MIKKIDETNIKAAESLIPLLEQKRREHLHEAQALENEISHTKFLIGQAYRKKKAADNSA